MIAQRPYPIEPWVIRETHLDLGLLPQSESLFALSNGHIGLRGNLDEGEPHGIAGTYLNSYYEKRPLPYAEPGYGYPEDDQMIINVTDGKLMRLLVDDESFDVRYGDVHEHHRRLDLRSGLLERSVDWTSPGQTRVRIRTRRLVSFVQRSVVAIEYIVEPVDKTARIILQSEMVANEKQPPASKDPRVAAALESPLVAAGQDYDDSNVVLLHRTRASDLLMGAGMSHIIQAPGREETDIAVRDDWARLTIACTVEPGQRLRVVKYLAYAWSSMRSEHAIRDQVSSALAQARFSGWDGLVADQREYLDNFWATADVVIDGDAELQQAVRFSLFHILQVGSRAERRALPSKGLTGPGYNGHTFWDTEMFVLPVLTYTKPDAAADALRWRHSTLDRAKARAKELHLKGATFPWRTIRGEECSGYWPAGTAAFHINADVAAAVTRYAEATGDTEFENDVGLELLVEIARLFMSLGHHDEQGGWHIDGITGPDEYSAITDDNVYTNLMAAHALIAAADMSLRHPARARELHVGTEESAMWRGAAASVHLPYDEEHQVHEQSEGWTSHAEWDFEERREYPLLLHAPYFDLYRKQVIKQADLVLAMHWRGDHFTPEEKARNFDYYERRTVRDSSLSACTQSVLAAELGHLDLAYDYAYEAALTDLLDLQDNSINGLHMASLGGAWLSLVAGFGGFRDYGGTPMFDPILPDGISRLKFCILWRGTPLSVDVEPHRVTYSVPDDAPGPVLLRHDGVDVHIAPGEPGVFTILPREPLLPAPEQPPGRAPVSARRPIEG